MLQKYRYILSLQHRDGTIKFDPEECNAVYCANRDLQVNKNNPLNHKRKLFELDSKYIDPKRIKFSNDAVSENIDLINNTPVKIGDIPKDSLLCDANVGSKDPSANNGAVSRVKLQVTDTTINCTNTKSKESPEKTELDTSDQRSDNSQEQRVSGVNSVSAASAASTSSTATSLQLCNKLTKPVDHSRGGQNKVSLLSAARKLSLPEMMASEERRGELELDLSEAVPGSALLVAEARFRKLINMNIIGVTSLNKACR